MYKEEFISGYCRTQDQSRMVAVELDNDSLEADCSYGACPYAASCTIAQRIEQLKKGSE